MTAELIIATIFAILTVLIFIRKFDSSDLSGFFKKSPVDIKAQSAGRKKMFFESKK